MATPQSKEKVMGLFQRGLTHEDIKVEFRKRYQQTYQEEWTLKLIDNVQTIEEELGTDPMALWEIIETRILHRRIIHGTHPAERYIARDR
jgi:hypothetical protein